MEWSGIQVRLVELHPPAPPCRAQKRKSVQDEYGVAPEPRCDNSPEHCTNGQVEGPGCCGKRVRDRCLFRLYYVRYYGRACRLEERSHQALEKEQWIDDPHGRRSPREEHAEHDADTRKISGD